MKGLGTLVALAFAFAVSLPAGAAAAVSGTFDDPIGDSPEYAADLGATTLTVGDDDTVVVNTRIVPRPPAGWGGCAYVVGFFPYETCAPSNMNVTWYFDHASGSGDPANDGADAKVVVVPSRGQVFWESDRWSAATGRYASGAQPLGAEDPGGVTFTLKLADLGIPKPAALRVWAVSLYKSYNGVGTLLNYSDTAGPGAVSIPAPPPSPQCLRAIGRANRLQRAIRRLKGKSGRLARRQRRKLLAKRRRATIAMSRFCQAPLASGATPKSAPPGCHMETRPVLQQEGAGIYAPWVIRSEPVVVCE